MNKVISAQAACPTSADYSVVTGDRILPFVFTLDGSSILYPSAGQNQRFVYTVRGIGADTSGYADLSHFVFTVCGNITEENLENVSVVIDGDTQDTVVGENVEIISNDNTTGCSGLKFDFGLDKVAGEMTVSYELNEPHEIGPINICVYGGRVSQSGLTICGPICGGIEDQCPTVAYRRANVCVPVTIIPFAEIGDTSVICCGSPTLSVGAASCPTANRAFTFTVTQEICVAVPMYIGATASAGISAIEEIDTAEGETCADCGS